MKALATALFVLAAWVGPAVSQEAVAAHQTPEAPGQAVAAELQTPAARLKLDTSLVSVDVLVTDKSGRVVKGLNSANFRIYDNGVPQKIASFGPSSDPITVVILMEFSAASYGYFAARAAAWSDSFLNHLEPRDWVALVTFDLRTKVQVDFTHNRAEVHNTLATIGTTSFREIDLYDALTDTLEMLDGISGKKSILLVATGWNTFSSSTFDDVRKRLQRSDATIFSVGLAEIEAIRSYSPGIGYLQAQNTLRTFSRQTGGFAMFPRFESELPGIFEDVVAFERNLYNLTFRIPQAGRDGRYHKLKVEVIGPDGKPLQITDEKGRKRTVEAHAREGYTAPRE